MKFPTTGELLKEYRKSLKITQTDLCMDNININTLSKLENDKVRISPVLAALLSNNLRIISAKQGEKLDISVNDLLMGTEKRCEKWCLEELKSIDDTIDDISVVNTYHSIIKAANDYGIDLISLDATERLANYFYNINKYEDAIEYYTICMDKYKKANIIYKMMNTMCNIGKCYYKIDKNEAFEYFIKTYKLLNSYPNDATMIEVRAKVLYNIALYYNEKMNFDESNKYIKEFSKLYGVNNNLVIKFYILKGNNEIGSNMYTKAKETFENLLKLPSSELSLFKHIIYNSLAICLYHDNDKKNALKYFDLAISEQLKNSLPSLTFYLLNAASAYMNNNNSEIAIRYIEGAIYNAKTHNQYNNIVDCYHIQYKIYKTKEQYEKCKELLKECSEFIDINKLANEYKYKNSLYIIDLAVVNNEYNNIQNILNKIL